MALTYHASGCLRQRPHPLGRDGLRTVLADAIPTRLQPRERSLDTLLKVTKQVPESLRGIAFSGNLRHVDRLAEGLDRFVTGSAELLSGGKQPASSCLENCGRALVRSVNLHGGQGAELRCIPPK